jgi:hypothetical protein
MMHHQRIALTSWSLLQRQQPIWCMCPTRCDTLDQDSARRHCFFLPQWHQKVLGEGKNGPPQSNLLGANRTWWYIIMTQRHQPTTPGAETIRRVQTMNKLMVWFQHRAGLADAL